MKIFESGISPNNENVKIAIITSRFNYFINKSLIESSIDTLIRIGNIQKKQISIFKVPGCYEIPFIAKYILESCSTKNQYNGVITLGTIIKGDTPHFKYISQAISSELIKISLKYAVPISFGILITNTIEQAIERAGTKMGNKGYESTICILEMINLLKTIN